MNCAGPAWIRVYFEAVKTSRLLSAPAFAGCLNIVNHSLIKPSGLNIWVFWADRRQLFPDPITEELLVTRPQSRASKPDIASNSDKPTSQHSLDEKRVYSVLL